MQEKARRIQELTTEINELNKQILALDNEISSSEQKIQQNQGGYSIESTRYKDRISSDINKIINLI